LILFVNPDQESLVLIMEDASTVRPISVEAHCFKVSITSLEEEVIINELLSLDLCHVVEGIVSTSKISSEILKSLNNT
jgi:hypothetical protein